MTTSDVTPSATSILHAVSAALNVPVRDIRSLRRHAFIIPARNAAYYLCKKLTDKSLAEIGRDIADRDHSTILHGIREAEKLMDADPAFREKVEAAGLAAIAMERIPLAERLRPADPVETARSILRDPYEAATRIRPDDLAALAARMLQADDICADFIQLLRIIDELVLDFPTPLRRREIARESKHLIPKITLALSALGHIKQELIDVQQHAAE